MTSARTSPAQVPWILAEANRFVEREAEGDLDAWARRFDIPAALVDALATVKSSGVV